MKRLLAGFLCLMLCAVLLLPVHTKADFGSYSGSKYNVLYGEGGIRYFISNGTSPSGEVTSSYVRQKRIMVTGTYMAHTPTLYNYYFDAKAVLNSTRGNVPQ